MHEKSISKSSVELGVTYDHHGYKLDDPSLKGLERYLNNSTIRGRANVAKLTIGCFAGLILFWKIQKPFGRKNINNDDNAVKN